MSTFLSSADSFLQNAAWPDWTNATSTGIAKRGGQNVVVGSQFSATLSAVKYRIAYCGPKGQKTTLYWLERTTNPDKTVTKVVHQQDVQFSGFLQYIYPDGQVVQPPAQAGQVEVEMVNPTFCKTCSPAGEGKVEDGCIYTRLSMGKLANGQSAGFLIVNQSAPYANLADTEILHQAVHPSVETIAQAGSIRQYRAPQALASVVATGPNEFQIWFYNNPGAKGTNGLYMPSGAPFKTWKFESLDQAGEQVRVTESNGQAPLVYEFTGTPAAGGWESGGTWTLGFPDNLRKDARRNDINPTDGIRAETHTVVNAQNQVFYKEVSNWQQFTGLGELLISQSVGPDNNPLLTSWQYYTDTVNDGAKLGKLKQEVRPGGSWDRYEYDTFGRPTNTVKGFVNAGAGAANSQCRVTEYSYTPVVSGDTGGLETNVPRRTIVKLLGQEIARGYAVILPGERRDIQCQTPGAAWDAADNLVTITKGYAVAGYDGWYESVLSPSGLMTITSHPTVVEGSSTTTRTWSGTPSTDGKSVVSGTVSTTVVGADGNLVSQTTADIATGATLSSTSYGGNDPGYGPTVMTYLDGTSEHTSYNCCGAEGTVDREGIVTAYGYDSLRRRNLTVRNGISTIYNYDPAGNVLSTVRQGTNGTQITLNYATYDSAGRVLTSTDAMSQTTTHDESLNGNGETVRTSTGPANDTRVETYNFDGSLKSVTGNAVHGVRYEYGVGDDGSGLFSQYTKEIKLDGNGADTSEWVKTYKDMLDRTYLTVYPDGATERSYYNASGQLWKQVDPDGVATLYGYNSIGELEYTAADVDHNDAIDLNGTDRVTRTVTDVSGGRRRTRTYAWGDNNVDSSTLVSTVESSPNGLDQWGTRFGLTSHTQTEYLGSGVRRVTQTAPDNSSVITVYIAGRVYSVNRKDADGGTIHQTTYGYDAHGRATFITDGRNGTATNTFNNADQIIITSTPPPGPGLTALSTTNYFNALGQPWRVDLPDGTSVTNEYYFTGELYRTYGSRTYPVEYAYDYAGRVKTMKTWQSFAGNAGVATTTWNYNSQRGFLTSKQHQGASGPSYTYKPSGRLYTRAWARTTGGQQLLTQYDYNNAGELEYVHYNDNVTPTVNYIHDRLGRVSNLSQYLGATVLDTVIRTFNGAGQVLAEMHTNGLMSGCWVTNNYDSLLRRTRLSLTDGNNLWFQPTYTYDAAGRLLTVSNGTTSATYNYVANSPLVQDIMYRNNGTVTMLTSKTYDRLNRLTQTASQSAGAPLVSFGYQYNSAGQRIRVTQADGSYWLYEYDTLGQVKSGKKYWSDNGKVAGQQFEYAFDNIGNRLTTKAGGDQNGGNLRSASYTPNLLNQYVSRTVPGGFDVLGVAKANATVTVNGGATYRKGEYFRTERSVNNSGVAAYPQVTVTSVVGTESTNQTGHVFLPATPEAYSYDADGNMTQDGHWNYTWDAENRLVALETTTAAVNDGVPKQRIEFTYDYQGRRVRKLILDWDGVAGAWSGVADWVYAYDGWNLISESQGLGVQGFPAPSRTYLWGLDLSRSQQGAGGVGGLLQINKQGWFNWTLYDGNGNVAALMDVANGTETAHYEYGPFGELIRSTGPMAKANPFRFSTKYQDEETGFLYYGYRYYDPSTGRWLSRDPIEERGGLDLYGFARNNPVSLRDALGLSVDPKTIIGPDDAVAYSRVGVGFVHDMLMGALRANIPVLSNTAYDKVRAVAPSIVFLANARLNNTGFRGNGANKFVFTCKCGWLDMGHFWGSALAGYNVGFEKAFTIGIWVEDVQSIGSDEGDYVERVILPKLFKALHINVGGGDGWSDSRYTVEDLPSDTLGSAFGRSLRAKDYALVPKYFNELLSDCGAVDPSKLTPAQWRILAREASDLETQQTRDKSGFPWRGKACPALCPKKEQNDDGLFAQIVEKWRSK